MASNLRRISKLIADAPDVDRNKVRAARRALARGTFKIDPNRIADKLIGLDTELRRRRVRNRTDR